MADEAVAQAEQGFAADAENTAASAADQAGASATNTEGRKAEGAVADKGKGNAEQAGFASEEADDHAEKSDDDADAVSEKEGEEADAVDYEVTLPEGYVLEGERKEIFTQFVKENNLSKEGAQKAVDLFIKLKEEETTAITEGWNTQAAAWLQASKAAGLLAPDVKRLANAGLTALDHDGSLRRTIVGLQLDKHPGIIQAFSAHGKQVSEDQSIPGSGAASGGKSRPEILYPNSKE